MRWDEAARERYARHLSLPEIGEAGQEKLAAARVLLVGVGGLGSPAGLYLAGAGIGVLGIVDGDALDLSNLQRQIAHATPDVGRPKVESAAETLEALNPNVRVERRAGRLTQSNAEEIVGSYDFVLDATDNLASKFLIADACHFAGKPYSHAGIDRFLGQTMTVLPGETACYRCVFSAPPPEPTPPPPPSGPLGAVPGVIGSIQATEAIKHIVGFGDLLTDRLLTYDASAMSFRTIRVRRSASCPLCGEDPTIDRPLSRVK